MHLKLVEGPLGANKKGIRRKYKETGGAGRITYAMGMKTASAKGFGTELSFEPMKTEEEQKPREVISFT
ncbi:hypothetical protein LDENG_00202300 [Lucifuga dentata]|nr:hypothetical protein LDENG_00202300 [Lucifuga dentata]